MDYIVLVGYLYLLFAVLMNIITNIKEKNKVFYLNVLGFMILMYLLVKELKELA
mgnify:CR=1 FL=1